MRNESVEQDASQLRLYGLRSTSHRPEARPLTPQERRLPREERLNYQNQIWSDTDVFGRPRPWINKKEAAILLTIQALALLLTYNTIVENTGIVLKNVGQEIAYVLGYEPISVMVDRSQQQMLDRQIKDQLRQLYK